MKHESDQPYKGETVLQSIKELCMNKLALDKANYDIPH